MNNISTDASSEYRVCVATDDVRDVEQEEKNKRIVIQASRIYVYIHTASCVFSLGVFGFVLYCIIKQ